MLVRYHFKRWADVPYTPGRFPGIRKGYFKAGSLQDTFFRLGLLANDIPIKRSPMRRPLPLAIIHNEHIVYPGAGTTSASNLPKVHWLWIMVSGLTG